MMTFSTARCQGRCSKGHQGFNQSLWVEDEDEARLKDKDCDDTSDQGEGVTIATA